MMKLEPGMRVRCVDANYTRLHEGREYTIESTVDDYVTVGVETTLRHASRFKPIIRVKAKSAPVITEGPFRGMTQDDALDLVIGGY